LAKEKREKLVRLTSPAGIARYPKLLKADEYQGKKSFKTDLIVTPSDDGVQEYLDEIEAAADLAFENTKVELQAKIDGAKNGKDKKKAQETLDKLERHLPFFPEENDDGEETGNVVVRFAKNAEFKDKKTDEIVQTKVHHFDANGDAIKRPPSVWGGSTIKVAADVFPFYNPSGDKAGVSLRLQGVQIIELITGGGASAKSMGFGKVDGGYSAAKDLDDSDDSDSDSSDGDSDSGGDF
jgi:hypothetical protein